jgi:hypothetical protein
MEESGRAIDLIRFLKEHLLAQYEHLPIYKKASPENLHCFCSTAPLFCARQDWSNQPHKLLSSTESQFGAS